MTTSKPLVFSSIRKQFFCCTSLKIFNWYGLLNDISWEEQDILIKNTVDHNLILKYPIKITYQKQFLKFLIQNLEKQGSEIHDCVFNAYGRLVALDGTCDTHKFYEFEENCLILKESLNIISEGTTGLCSWQASIVLSEWCLANKDVFKNKRVLELGSGVGLTGLSIAFTCFPQKIYLTDCHEAVLQVLNENVLLNLNNESPNSGANSSLKQSARNCVEVLKLPWEKVNNPVCRELGEIDVVIAADVVYDSDLFESLVSAIKCFLENGACKVILACTERNRVTLDAFLEVVKSVSLGFQLLELPVKKEFLWNTETPVRIYEIGLK